MCLELNVAFSSADRFRLKKVYISVYSKPLNVVKVKFLGIKVIQFINFTFFVLTYFTSDNVTPQKLIVSCSSYYTASDPDPFIFSVHKNKKKNQKLSVKSDANHFPCI